MKKKDMIIIVVLCVVIGIGYLAYQAMQGEKSNIEVYHEKDLIDTIDISVDKTYTYEGSYGVFHLEVKDRQYRAIDVECPNHDCEKIGWVKEGSSTSIVCLPNGIYVIQSGTVDQVQ